MTKSKNGRTFDSMKAAASGMKLALRIIQAAKAGGCGAFRSNRIYEAELALWLADHPEVLKQRGSAVDLKGRKTKEEIRKLKNQNGKDIAIFGSSDLALSLIEGNLIDEFRIIISPTVIGDGKSLFAGVGHRLHLKLIKSKVFDSGNVLLYYEKKNN